MRVISLIVIFISLTGCLTEPTIETCTLIPLQFEPDEIYEGRCHTIGSDGAEKEPRTLQLFDMIGYQMVSPDDFGKIKQHHDELHKRLEHEKNK